MSLVTPLPPALAALVNSSGPVDKSATAALQPQSGDPATIAKLETQANSDGSITTTTTFSDGSSSTSVQPNPNPKHASNPLNSTQLGPLLSAQESRAHTVITFGQSPYANIR
jgi:hypothetical protein